MRLRQKLLLTLVNWWPPFWGAGIRVRRIASDFKAVDVEMKLRWFNKNYVGVHFGGSLYSLTDPWFMLMVLENLGPEYIVWDKSAVIHFRKPGRGRVSAQFRLREEELGSIRSELEKRRKIEPKFMVEIKDESGEVIAEVEKVLYIRRKHSRS